MSLLLLGDCVEVMAGMDAGSVDAVVTDPPYGIGFMGREWDSFSPAAVRLRTEQIQRKGTERTSDTWPGRLGKTSQGAGVAIVYDDKSASGNRRFQAWVELWAAECLRVLKPGGHLVSFGGTRTYHRLAAGVEDAGFEIRDQLAWLFGSGFPKSRNLGDGYGTALKPAHEPIVLARKPLVGTVADNVALHGVGGLNIDGCRIDTDDDLNGGTYSGELRKPDDYTSTDSAPGAVPFSRRKRGIGEYVAPDGRWPANVVLDEEAASMLDEQSGELHSQDPATRNGHERRTWAAAGTDTSDAVKGGRPNPNGGDSGGASRFFYCAKTSRAERNAGLDGFAAAKSADDGYGSIQTPILDRAAPRENWEPHKSANIHPTVKPIALMRWLCRLVTPPGGLILDPFLGSGTTGIAATLEGFRFVGIEREPDYIAIAQARIAFWEQHGDEALRIAYAIDERETIAATGQTSLLDQETAA